MIDNAVCERSVSESVNIGYLQQKMQKNLTPLSSVRSPPHSKIVGTPLLCPVLKMKSRRLCICVLYHFVCRIYCWVHFVTIAKMYGNLFIGRPSKVLVWS